MGSFGPGSRTIAGAGSPRGWDWDPDSRGRRPQGQSSDKARGECGFRELGGERAERALTRTEEQAEHSFSLGPGGGETRHPGCALGLEISVP